MISNRQLQISEICGFVVGIILIIVGHTTAKVFYNVTCGSDIMQVTLNLTSHPSSIVYLQNLKGYPGCEPKVSSNIVLFQLSLNETGVHCGVSKMLNKQTGHNIFYHRVVIEIPKEEKELLFLQCVIPGDFNMDFVRIDWLRESVPYNYTTPSMPFLNLSQDIVPYVNMAVRDKGVRLDTSAVVHPGSLLDLLIYLDKESSAHYDISLRYLTFADATRSQEEVVVMNGCSVDPYVIQVFRPVDGVLKSQFRAFKFQSSEFVIFLATVSVCLQECVEVDCYGEMDKSGRRKREIPKFLPHYNNEVFEVEVSAFLRFKTNVEGDIIIEESTNETLDLYDTDYSNDLEMLTPEVSSSDSKSLRYNYYTLLFMLCLIFITVRRLLS